MLYRFKRGANLAPLFIYDYLIVKNIKSENFLSARYINAMLFCFNDTF